jgi:phage terminase Nu1 subunit (DNA packaging protein)
LTPQAISGWTRAGCPREGGKFDLVQVIAWRESILRAEADEAESAGDSEALERLRTARAEIAELELAERRGQLLDRAGVELWSTKLALSFKSNLMRLGQRLGFLLRGAANDELGIKKIVDSEVKVLLDVYANARSSDDAS